MDVLLRRYLWVVDLIGIMVGAALAGDATATLIAAALPMEAAPSARRVEAAVPPTPPPPPNKSVEHIVQRNIFCSTCTGTRLPEQTRRALTLLAIMYAPPPSDPRWSVAIVRDDAAATTGPYAVGARLGDATVAAIEDVRVVLDEHGRTELLELLPQRRSPPGRAPAKATFDGIRQTAANRFEVRRDVLEQFLAGGITPGWPRVVPQARDGEVTESGTLKGFPNPPAMVRGEQSSPAPHAPIGFRVFGIAANSPFAALGLASGDVLLQVNGRSIATPAAALAAVTSLRTANHVSLSIARGDRLIRLDYDVRDAV